MLEALSSRFSISLLIACAVHVIVLFGFVAGTKAPAPDPVLRVTLSTQPTALAATDNTIAIANQLGTEKSSAAPTLSGNPSAQAATGTTQKNDAQPNTVAILARPVEHARTNNRPSPTDKPKSIQESAQPETQTALAHTAQADERAAYLDAWRRIVERIGNHKLPDALVQQSAGKSLTLEVALDADGDIISMRVRHSSGSTALDAAAQQLLREAAPFSAFPDALRRHYQSLRFAYDWRFVSGAGQSETDSP